MSQKAVELERSLESERLAFKREQQSLENKIVDMTTSAANLQTDTADKAGEVRVQEDRAQVRI